jgi:uridine kinase
MMKQIEHPIVIFVRGLPGSGKSHIAAALREAIAKTTGADVVTLDPDAIDYDSEAYTVHVSTATVEGVDSKLYAYRFLRAQAYQAIEAGKIIIWNQPFTNLDIFNKMVVRLRTHATEHDVALSILVVEVYIDQDIAKVRIAERKQQGGHGPSNDTFQRFAADYVSFSDKGYDTIAIDGEDDISISVPIIMQRLQAEL